LLELAGKFGLAWGTMQKVAWLGLLVLGLTAGCAAPTIRDGRGPSEICEVHHTIMQEMVVPAPLDNTPLPQAYVADGIRYFPHGTPEFKPSHHDKLVIYICDECVRAQEAWKRAHPGVVP
jgi:hypothetical protein